MTIYLKLWDSVSVLLTMSYNQNFYRLSNDILFNSTRSLILLKGFVFALD